MKQLSVQVRLRNNLLLERREDFGLSQGDLAEMIGISKGAYCGHEAMSKSPIRSCGEWKQTAQRIADYYRVLPDDLWPEAIQAIRGNVAKRTMDVDEFASLEPGEYSLMLAGGMTDDELHKKEIGLILRETIDCLPERLSNIVKQYYGIDCVPRKTQDIDNENDRCRQNTHVLRQRALALLRRSKRLRDAAFGNDDVPLSDIARERFAHIVREAEIERLSERVRNLRFAMPRRNNGFYSARRRELEQARKELRELVQLNLGARKGKGS